MWRNSIHMCIFMVIYRTQSATSYISGCMWLYQQFYEASQVNSTSSWPLMQVDSYLEKLTGLVTNGAVTEV